ncbi:OmpA family protein [Nocardiopsis sp. NPDC050513]|uniref:OmpA family protein n=1 Tax=Nocardiopsis sp. NPDC050513 TaxID=3364338 RepID=UPI00379882BC
MSRFRQSSAILLASAVLLGIPYVLLWHLEWPRLDLTWAGTLVHIQGLSIPPGLPTAILIVLLWSLWGLYLAGMAVEGVARLRGTPGLFRRLGPMQAVAATAAGAAVLTPTYALADAAAEEAEDAPADDDGSPPPVPVSDGTQAGESVERERTIAGFATDSAELTDAMREDLAPVVELVRDHGAPGAPIQITGHADPRGTDEHNLELSERRAQVVADHLTAELGDAAPETVVRGVGSEERREGDYAAQRRVDLVYTVTTEPAPSPTTESADPAGSTETAETPASTDSAETTGTTGSAGSGSTETTESAAAPETADTGETTESAEAEDTAGATETAGTADTPETTETPETTASTESAGAADTTAETEAPEPAETTEPAEIVQVEPVETVEVETMSAASDTGAASGGERDLDEKHVVVLEIPDGAVGISFAFAGVLGGYVLGKRGVRIPGVVLSLPRRLPPSPRRKPLALPPADPRPTPGDDIDERVSVELGHVPGIGVTGKGATGAARRLLLNALDTSDEQTARVVITEADTARLIGEEGRDLLRQHPCEPVRMVGTVEGALEELRSELHQRADEALLMDDPTPLVLVTSAAPEHETALSSLLLHGQHRGISAVVLGRWPLGGSLAIEEDGLITETSTPLAPLAHHSWPGCDADEVAEAIRAYRDSAPAEDTERTRGGEVRTARVRADDARAEAEAFWEAVTEGSAFWDDMSPDDDFWDESSDRGAVTIDAAADTPADEALPEREAPSEEEAPSGTDAPSEESVPAEDAPSENDTAVEEVSDPLPTRERRSQIREAQVSRRAKASRLARSARNQDPAPALPTPEPEAAETAQPAAGTADFSSLNPPEERPAPVRARENVGAGTSADESETPAARRRRARAGAGERRSPHVTRKIPQAPQPPQMEKAPVQPEPRPAANNAGTGGSGSRPLPSKQRKAGRGRTWRPKENASASPS